MPPYFHTITPDRRPQTSFKHSRPSTYLAVLPNIIFNSSLNTPTEKPDRGHLLALVDYQIGESVAQSGLILRESRYWSFSSPFVRVWGTRHSWPADITKGLGPGYLQAK